jgi:hypothetical protein
VFLKILKKRLNFYDFFSKVENNLIYAKATWVLVYLSSVFFIEMKIKMGGFLVCVQLMVMPSGY